MRRSLCFLIGAGNPDSAPVPLALLVRYCAVSFRAMADNVQVAGIFAVSRSNVHVLSRTVTFLLAIATRTEYSLEA